MFVLNDKCQKDWDSIEHEDHKTFQKLQIVQRHS